MHCPGEFARIDISRFCDNDPAKEQGYNNGNDLQSDKIVCIDLFAPDHIGREEIQEDKKVEDEQ